MVDDTALAGNRPKALPQATPATRPYWDGCTQHELRIQHCSDCKEYYFFTWRYCAKCFGENAEWRKVSGKGTLHTHVISHRAAPGIRDEIPFTIAVVKLAEGPRLMTNTGDVAIAPENLPADLPVEVVFEDVNDEITLPRFQRARSA